MTALDFIKIGNHRVGEGNPAYVIAEIGFNHGGDMSLGIEMIKAAARAGADAVKFQSYKADELVVESSEHFALIKSGELDLEQHLQLSRVAAEYNITFFSTPYSPPMVDLLEKVDVPAYKIASMDLTNLPLIHYVAETQKPVLISTGMGTIDEIATALETIRQTGNQNVLLFHCISQYPAEPQNANLKSITQLTEKFNTLVGYSDHVYGNAAALAAVTLGATAIEKHFTSDKNLAGPDHAISADESELLALIEDIREVEKLLGRRGVDENRPDRIHAEAFRRSLHARTDIPQGAVITEQMIVTVRPGEGLPPSDINKLLGQTATTDIAKGQLMSWESIDSGEPPKD